MRLLSPVCLYILSACVVLQLFFPKITLWNSKQVELRQADYFLSALLCSGKGGQAVTRQWHELLYGSVLVLECSCVAWKASWMVSCLERPQISHLFGADFTHSLNKVSWLYLSKVKSLVTSDVFGSFHADVQNIQACLFLMSTAFTNDLVYMRLGGQLYEPNN